MSGMFEELMQRRNRIMSLFKRVSAENFRRQVAFGQTASIEI
jgi:hypothetical protein